MEQNYVYVQDINGNPLMSTKRFGKVRRMLKSGQARVVIRKPFTIQLNYQPETNVLQPVYLGMDPGRTNIGLAAVREDGECLYLAHAETRNKEVPKNMADRKSHRQASRRGERLRRKRRARKNGTTMLHFRKTSMGIRPEMCYDKKQNQFHVCKNRYLPHYNEPVVPREIRNTEARFLNRKREPGWLTPTANQLLQTHINLIRLVCKILPITDVVTEINKFAFMSIEDPSIKGIDFQNGKLKGFSGPKGAVSTMQNGKCLLCKKKSIEHYHHMLPRFRGGGNTVDNLVGLCESCHEKVHKDTAAKEKLSRLHGSRNKKYGALSVLNQIIPYLIKEIGKLFPNHNYVTTGYNTKEIRDHFGLEKDHELDAYCIASEAVLSSNLNLLSSEAVLSSNFGNKFKLNKNTVSFEEQTISALRKDSVKLSDCFPEKFEIKQFRRHNKAIIGAQYERTYYYDGKVVAKNRHKRMAQIDGSEKGQAFDSLAEWYQKQVKLYGVKEANKRRSQLTVKKSYRRYNNPDRLLPGAEFRYQKKRYILRGQHNNGTRYYFFGRGKDCPSKECHLVRKNSGLVYL